MFVCGLLKKRVDSITENLIGKKFGRLQVIEKSKDKTNYWLCLCECGNKKIVYGRNLLIGATKSCGCLHKEVVRKSLLIDLTGQHFGRWTVLEIDGLIQKTATYWKCRCDCGTIKSIRASSLTTGNSTSCGCYRKEFTSNLLTKNIKGQKFGKLTVIERKGSFVGEDGTKYAQWLCKCDCGNQKIVRGHDLIAGKVSSCGCLISKGEYLTRQALLNRNFLFDTQYSFEDLKSDKNRKLKFDFAIFNCDNSLNCLVEFQGPQHDSSKEWYYKVFGKQQREITDLQKKEYCSTHNILLHEIWDVKDIDNILDQIKLNII